MLIKVPSRSATGGCLYSWIESIQDKQCKLSPMRVYNHLVIGYKDKRIKDKRIL